MLMGKIRALVRDVSHKGFFHLFSANLIMTFLGFGSQLLVVKFLSPAEMGNIKTLQSFMSVGMILSGFGFNSAILKLCSEKKTIEEKSQILKQTAYYSLVPIVIVMLGVFFIAKYGYFSPVDEINYLIVLYMFILPSSALSSLFIGYLQALKKIKLMAKLQIYIRILGVVSLVVFTYYYKITGYISSLVLISTVGLFPLLVAVKNEFITTVKSDFPFSKTFYYAKWSLAANLLTTISGSMDIFMLNYLIEDRSSIGYYSIASIFMLALGQINATVQNITTPYFSDKSDDKNEFIRILKKYQRIMVIGSFCVSVMALIFVPIFISVIYGSKYSVSIKTFEVLCFKHFIMSSYAILGVAIWGLGQIKYNFYAQIFSLCVTVPLSYILIISNGVIGAAIAQVITCLLTLLIMLIMVRLICKSHFKSICI